MAVISKQEADAWDRVLDGAAGLAELIESGGIELDEYVLEELTIWLASHGYTLRQILRGLKMTWSDED